jgi:hypothetical protein
MEVSKPKYVPIQKEEMFEEPSDDKEGDVTLRFLGEEQSSIL